MKYVLAVFVMCLCLSGCQVSVWIGKPKEKDEVQEKAGKQKASEETLQPKPKKENGPLEDGK